MLQEMHMVPFSSDCLESISYSRFSSFINYIKKNKEVLWDSSNSREKIHYRKKEEDKLFSTGEK